MESGPKAAGVTTELIGAATTVLIFGVGQKRHLVLRLKGKVMRKGAVYIKSTCNFTKKAYVLKTLTLTLLHVFVNRVSLDGLKCVAGTDTDCCRLDQLNKCCFNPLFTNSGV